MWEGCATMPAYALVAHSHRRGLPGGSSKHGSAVELAGKGHAGGGSDPAAAAAAAAAGGSEHKLVRLSTGGAWEGGAAAGAAVNGATAAAAAAGGQSEELQAALQEVARLRARLAMLEGLPAGEPAV